MASSIPLFKPARSSARSGNPCPSVVWLTQILHTQAPAHPTMLSSFTEKLSKLYYGWRMIGLVSAIRVVGGGLHQYGFTVFFLPVSQELGISRAMTSLAFSLARAEGAIESPVAGYLIDRYGPSPMMVAACLLAGIGYILFSYINSYTTFLIV
ncbi:MAG: MFS transporter, partial [Deltaproteobacteria bacterium]|nr:MFS transporter [Deltaproteobacteria bacterium]